MSDDPMKIDTPEAEEAGNKKEAGGQASMTDEDVVGSAKANDELSELRVALERTEKEASEHRDAALRAQAEVQNIRRRAERDVEHAHKFGQEKLINEILPVVDNLERALEVQGEGGDFAKSLREGVEMTLSLMLKALEKFQVVQINPQGEPFDPQMHQAMSMVENPNVEPNTVIAVMQKGYSLHGRLVRPAMVMVSKAAAGRSPIIDEQA